MDFCHQYQYIKTLGGYPVGKQYRYRLSILQYYQISKNHLSLVLEPCFSVNQTVKLYLDIFNLTKVRRALYNKGQARVTPYQIFFLLIIQNTLRNHYSAIALTPSSKREDSSIRNLSIVLGVVHPVYYKVYLGSTYKA